MRNSKASDRLMHLMAETVSLLGTVKDIRAGMESHENAEDTLDALEHVQSSFTQAFDALKIAENEAVDMETQPELTDHELLIAASAKRDEDETPTLIFPLCDVLGLPIL